MSLQARALHLILLVGVLQLQGLFTVVRSECADGVCVPLAKCKNYHVDELISVRLEDSECEHYLDVCCDRDNVVNDTVICQPVTVRPHNDVSRKFGNAELQFGECGIRNKDGVGFRVSDAKHRDAQFGEFPWMVAILQFDPECSSFAHKYSCGGSLIAPNAVLTAAHCVADKTEDSLVVRAGEWDTKTTSEVFPHQERKLSKIIVHEHYNTKAMANDIAVLLLEEPFTADRHIQLACLPPQGKVFDSKECIAAGWGKTNYVAQNYQAILKKLQLAMVPKAECQEALQTTRLGPKFRLHNSFVCAGGQKELDTCTGDGGSPLICPDPDQDNKYYQAGIVSWGIDCGQEGVPGVYVKTSLYTDWINEKIGAVGQAIVVDTDEDEAITSIDEN